jgi:hypothetical protein
VFQVSTFFDNQFTQFPIGGGPPTGFTPGATQSAAFDNVALNVTVAPEPSTWALMIGAALPAGCSRRFLTGR